MLKQVRKLSLFLFIVIMHCVVVCMVYFFSTVLSVLVTFLLGDHHISLAKFTVLQERLQKFSFSKISGRHSREILKKLSAPLFEPNTLSGKHLFRMTATKKIRSFNMSGANVCQETASNFVLK